MKKNEMRREIEMPSVREKEVKVCVCERERKREQREGDRNRNSKILQSAFLFFFVAYFFFKNFVYFHTSTLLMSFIYLVV